MALPTPTKSTKEFPRHPAGSYQLILADVIYLGHRTTEWKGTEKAQERVALVWQSLEIEPDANARFELANEFTYSVSPKANLRGFLEGWLGAFPNDDAATAALVGLDGKIGANVIGAIIHVPSQDGTKTYVNIKSVAPLMKGMQPQQIAGYTRRDYWGKRITEYADAYTAFLAKQAAQKEATATALEDFPKALESDDDSDLPF